MTVRWLACDIVCQSLQQRIARLLNLVSWWPICKGTVSGPINKDSVMRVKFRDAPR